MMRTTNNPQYISSSTNTKEYNNLNDELLSIHHLLGNVSKQLESHEETEKKDNNDFILNVKKEIDAVNNTINNIVTNHIKLESQRISTVTSNKYINGLLVEQSVTGDVTYSKKFTYNSSKKVIKESVIIDGKEVGYKNYTYDTEGNITKIVNNNVDNVLIATSKLAYDSLDKRIEHLESTDILNISNMIKNGSLEKYIKAVNSLCNDMLLLKSSEPKNISNIASIPKLVERVKGVESRVYHKKPIYVFYVKACQNAYDLPPDVDDKTAIYLEGILLVNNDDYVIEKEKIIFKIPLQDDYYVQCKY